MKRCVLIVLLCITAACLCSPAFGEGVLSAEVETRVYLNVNATLRIVSLAPDAYVKVGADHEIFALVEGFGSLHYEWYFNGRSISDGSGVSEAENSLREMRIAYTVQDFTAGDAGQYTIKVWDDFGNEATSEIVTLRRRSGSGGGGSISPVPRTGDDWVSMLLMFALLFVSGTGFGLQVRLYAWLRRPVYP